MRHSTGASPPAYAATRHRSTKPARGTGSATRRDDHELLGVGHHQPFDGVGVVGGAAQHGGALLDPDDAGERVRCARQVADEPDPVAHDDRGAAQLAGPHRGDRRPGWIGVGRARPPAAVDDRDHRLLGVGVVGAALRAGTRATPGPHPDVGLVVLPRAQPSSHRAVQRPGKSGMVLAVQLDVVDHHAGHDQPDQRARRGHPVVGVGPPGRSPRAGRPGRISRPSAVSATSPPSALISARARPAGRSRGRAGARPRGSATGPWPARRRRRPSGSAR